jgi:FAD/FMN-containing dehydrogenase
MDLGRMDRRVPVAVLKPRSVDDIVKIVLYANEHGLKVVMRGQGHSRYGRALVEGGVVIDSRALKDVRLVWTEYVRTTC